MNWFSNLKIRFKLIICFMVVAAFIAVVGTIGIKNMSQINRRANEMYTMNFQPIAHLTLIQKNLLYIRSYMRRILMNYN